MEAVKLAFPAAVAVSKLMGSDTSGGARVTVGDAEACESDCVPIFVNPKIEKCSSVLSHGGHVTTSESSSAIKKTDAESCWSTSQLPRSMKEDMPQELNHGGMSSPVVLTPGSEEKQLQGKGGKVPRSGNGCFKRPRMPRVENMMSQAEVDMKAASDKFGTLSVKCSNGEKSQTMRTKSSLNSKRGDRRSSKVPVRAKSENFSPKAGSVGFNSAPGGSNAFGIYGLKSDVHDGTKLMDDISLNELLEGSYQCPTFSKDKGKKAASMHENILDAVRKACSVLRVQGPVLGKQSEEVDIGLNKKTPLLPSTSSSCVASGTDGDQENNQAPDLSSFGKSQESCIKVKAPADSGNPPLFLPGDILERLALPSPKDLESLLQDAAKPAASLRYSDPRSSKPISYCLGLPPFPWSHNFNGHCKSNSEAAKLSNRSTCQGRWVRMQYTPSFLGGGTECFTNLGSLSYDSSLVPAGRLKYALPESASASTYISVPQFEPVSSSAVCPTASQSPHESGSSVDCRLNGLHSPIVLAAAQTLCDIANQCWKNDPNGIMKWPKWPSQKAMKARKFKSSGKSEDHLQPKSEMILNFIVRTEDHVTRSKKPKHCMTEKKEDFSHINAIRGPNYWSAPRSSRSSPIRGSRDSVVEAKQCNGNFEKQPFILPPLARVLDKPSHGQQKLRKVVPMDWRREKS
ncbi:hypothetical protein Ancab_032737 [Ancistrocladus abbreviatus]